MTWSNTSSLKGLPKCGAVKIGEFADTLMSVFNVAFYSVAGQVDKPGRQLGQQHLEA